jgi:hypothetical protein
VVGNGLRSNSGTRRAATLAAYSHYAYNCITTFAYMQAHFVVGPGAVLLLDGLDAVCAIPVVADCGSAKPDRSRGQGPGSEEGEAMGRWRHERSAWSGEDRR